MINRYRRAARTASTRRSPSWVRPQPANRARRLELQKETATALERDARGERPIAEIPFKTCWYRRWDSNPQALSDSGF